MMRSEPTRSLQQRDGITLFEVVVALAIFLFSVVLLVEITSVGSEYALTAHRKSHGTLLCQSVMAEAETGIIPLTGGDWTAFEDDGNKNWQWKIEALPGRVDGLLEVQAFVRTEIGQDKYYEVSLSRFVMEPMLRGTNADRPAEPQPEPEKAMPEDTEESNDAG